MRSFTYVRPSTIQEACAALQQYGDEARVLAGGQSLLNMLKLRILRPAYLVDIGRIPDLKGHSRVNGYLEIGAATNYYALETATLPPGPVSMIKQVAGRLGDMAVRNMGTIGGSLCLADPHSDFPTVAVALGAELTACSAKGSQVLKADSFFRDFYETGLTAEELLTVIRFPIPDALVGWSFQRFSLRLGDHALVSVACTLATDNDGVVESARLCIGSTESTPVRANKAEQLVVGQQFSQPLAEEAGRVAMGEIEPLPDPLLCGPDYKRELVKTLTSRALCEAHSRIVR